VWAECEIDGDEVTPASQPSLFRKTGDMGSIPPGWYRWKRPAHQGGEWIIAGRLKVNRVLTADEVTQLRRSHS
jgi:hypothetical protein